MAANIWLASYPKSGNTWVRIFLSCLFTGAAADINNLDVGGIASSRRCLDGVLDLATSDLPADVVECLRPRVYDQMAAEATEDIFWKAHDLFHRTADGDWLFPPGSTRSAVYMVRDPRDVAPSLAHHKGIAIDAAIAMMGDADAMLSRARFSPEYQVPQKLGRWGEHVESWLAAPFPVHLMRYEDMRENPQEAFGGMVRFLGRDDGAEAIAAAVDMASFERLSGQESREGFREKLRDSTAPFFRSGRVGAWKGLLTAAQENRIIADHGAVMERLGYLAGNDG